MSKPERIVLVVCPVCGRTDRWSAKLHIGRAHFSEGKKCDGELVEVEYVPRSQLAEREAQIDKLAEFIMREVEGEPSQNQGAIDTAIRLLAEREADPFAYGCPDCEAVATFAHDIHHTCLAEFRQEPPAVVPLYRHPPANPEREAEVKRLREAGDALADALDALLPLLDRAENKKGAEYVRLKKDHWHTATGGTTDA